MSSRFLTTPIITLIFCFNAGTYGLAHDTPATSTRSALPLRTTAPLLMAQAQKRDPAHTTLITQKLAVPQKLHESIGQRPAKSFAQSGRRRSPTIFSIVAEFAKWCATIYIMGQIKVAGGPAGAVACDLYCYHDTIYQQCKSSQTNNQTVAAPPTKKIYRLIHRYTGKDFTDFAWIKSAGLFLELATLQSVTQAINTSLIAERLENFLGCSSTALEAIKRDHIYFYGIPPALHHTWNKWVLGFGAFVTTALSSIYINSKLSQGWQSIKNESSRILWGKEQKIEPRPRVA